MHVISGINACGRARPWKWVVIAGVLAISQQLWAQPSPEIIPDTIRDSVVVQRGTRFDRGTSGARIGVWNINLCDNEKCNTNPYREQVGHIALHALQLAAQDTLRLDLFGLNETRAKRVGDLWGGGPGYNIHYEAQDVRCDPVPPETWPSGGSMSTAACFGRHLRNGLQTDLHAVYGEVGIVARGDGPFFGLGYNHRRLGGSGLSGQVKRDVVGTRLLIQQEGYVLPFISTHLTGEKLDETRDLIKAIRDWWVPGDLTPVVVGDFNYGAGNRRFDEMATYFTLVGAAQGAGSDIELTWVGKVAQFPGAVGAVIERKWLPLGSFANVAADLSDHNAPYAEFETPPEDCAAIPAALQVSQHSGGAWLVVSGSRQLMSFRTQHDAQRAIQVIQHYGLNESCFVGRPIADFRYLRRSGALPTGSLTGEDCVPIAPAHSQVRFDNGVWKIMEGTRSIEAFANAHGAALRALSLMKYYAATRQCFVGRPNAGMKYLRR